MSMKNSSDTIGNRNRDLPTCSAVPQPTAPPRAPNNNNNILCTGFVAKNGSYLSMHGVNNLNKYSYFPHLSSEFDEIVYTSSGHYGVQHLCVSCTVPYTRP